MKNQIYRIEMESKQLEFSVVGPNELEPPIDIMMLGVCLFDGESQLDGGLELDELESFIDYLNNVRTYIKNFNEKSKPKTAD